jgi:hypothetical protein
MTVIFKMNTCFFVNLSITLTLWQQFKNHFADTHTQKFYKLSMPEKNVNLSVHKMSWNSRSKLNFAQYFKRIHTQN